MSAYTQDQLQASMAQAALRRQEFEASGSRKRTMTQTGALEHALTVLVALEGPMTVRGAFYRAVSFGAVPKNDDTGYNWVQNALVKLRQYKRIPYSGIVDLSRVVTQVPSWTSPTHAIRDMLRTYKRDIWADQDTELYFIVEKDALLGVVRPVVNEYGANIASAKGYSSLTLLDDLSGYIDDSKLTVVYQLGDHDPSGADAWRKFQTDLTAMLADADKDLGMVKFERLAVTPEQIITGSLQTRPTKKQDARYKSWYAHELAAGRSGESVEVEAIPPDELRAIVREAIEDNLDWDAYETTLEQQEDDRAWLEGVIHV